MQDYEESVSFLGTWGPFQRRVFLLLCLSSAPCGYNLLSVIFLLASPTHHCSIPAYSNLSQEWIEASIPLQQGASLTERSSCSRYVLDVVQELSANGTRPILDQTQNQSLSGSGSSLRQEGCRDGWIYSTEHYDSTVVTEEETATWRTEIGGVEWRFTCGLESEELEDQFNLVCSDQWKQPLSSLVYFLGGLCGCFISGQISDRFGRKPVMFGAIAILSIFSIAVAFAPSWPIFTVLFFIVGMGQIGCYIVVFVLGSEILTGQTRVLFSSLCLPFVYTFAMMLLPGAAYLTRSWRYLALTMAAPGLACIPLWWLIPESPRWLVSQGRLQEAELVLRSAALENRVEPPNVIFLSAKAEKTTSQEIESLNFLDLLRTKNIRCTTLILWFIWFAMTLAYFGFSFNMSSLYGNPFLNNFLLTAIELPGYITIFISAHHIPRRSAYGRFTMAGVLALALVLITMHWQPTVTLVLVLLGKFGILVGSGTVYVYTSELFPTVIRNTAMATSVFHESLPWMLLAYLSLISMILCFFLPETFKQPIPDTIQQMAPIRRIPWPWTSTPTPRDDGKSAKEQTTALEPESRKRKRKRTGRAAEGKESQRRRGVIVSVGRAEPNRGKPSRAGPGWAVLPLQPGRRHGNGEEEEEEEEEVVVEDKDEALLLQERPMSNVTMEATSILPILKKKLAFLSGGKDRRSGLILTIPLSSDQTSMEELSATLDYLLSIPSEKCKARGFTVIVDGRKSQWNIVKTVVLMLQV
ncbi:hypothetical protein INR49_010190 [Caranx melampygus]|nr:hypothetical protein INR49_010190 [Caranx melampygus]